MLCPDLQTLEDGTRGRLDPETWTRIQTHCESCPECQGTWSEVRSNFQLEQSLRLLTDTVSSMPQQIGSFRILRELGRGAMGVVVLAEQDQPRREVALKLLPSFQSGPEHRRRFADEVELLGRLQHPGIAQIHDAGIASVPTSVGTEQVPYFAMEYVKGMRVDQYVESKKLGAHERIELLAAIADAVHHAHGRGVLHRDLKPSNILVQDPEGAMPGQPKVLDFGVARALDRIEGEQREATRAGQLVGTLPFMSPEQVSGSPHDLDARSDVYALGVLGYLLLSGRHPLELEDCSVAEAVRRIQEATPPPLTGAGFRVSADVQLVIATAMRSDPADRYQSASEFAADLRRALRDEPVAAHPLGATYQLSKLIRRHRVGFAAGVGIFLLTMGLAVAMSVLYQRARVAERQAQLEAESAQQMSDYLYAMFGESLPRSKSPDDVTARDLIESGLRRVETLQDQPEVQARMLYALGQIYREMGDYDSSLPLLERSRAIRQEVLDEPHLDLATSESSLGSLALHQGDADESVVHFREAIRQLRVLDDAPPRLLQQALNGLGMALNAAGNYQEAISVYREALTLAQSQYGPDHPEAAVFANNLAVAYVQLEQYAQAIPILESSHDILVRQHGEDHVRVGSSHANLGAIRHKSGDYEGAERHFRRALAIQRNVLGDEHPNVAAQWHRLALALQSQDQLTEAEHALRTALRIRAEAIPDHWFTAETRSVLGEVLAAQGHRAEAEPLLRQGAEAIVAARGAEDPFAQRAQRRLTDFLAASGGR